MSTNRSGTGLSRSAVDWYANTLVAVVFLGAVTFVLLALRLGPTEIFVRFGLSLVVVFVVLFVSLLTGSGLVYNYLGSLDDST